MKKMYMGGGQPLLNKKAFTLIELLAVIVILAIIALIAVPIIINIINDSRESSNKRSIELYGKAVENALAKKQLDGTVLPDGEYELNNEGDVCHKTQTDKCITPEVNATKPISYTMTLTNGEIVLQTIQLKSGQPTYRKVGNGSWTKVEESNNEEPANNEEQNEEPEQPASSGPDFYSWDQSQSESGVPDDAVSNLSELETNGYSFYLGYDTADGTKNTAITAAYVCFTTGNPTEEYCLKYGDYSNNVSILDTVFPGDCYLSDDVYTCDYDNNNYGYISVNVSGGVSVGSGDTHCDAYSSSFLYCIYK